MVGSNGRDDVISIERRLIHDGAVSVLMDGTKAPEVQTKSDGLDDDPPSDECKSNDDLNNGGGDEFSSSLTGKRLTRRRFPYPRMRRSRRVPLRSRNETVDDWLAMDDDEFGSAPGEG